LKLVQSLALPVINCTATACDASTGLPLLLLQFSQ